ncbi:MAG: endonuclease domain-containing protein [Ruminococcus sp.]|nr:endonuclease domain-containing protein [Ruminococcus sp.]
MNKTNNTRLTGFSQHLRRNMTKEEKRLWYDFLRKLNLTVNRQKVIGNYIVDFYIADARLIIELDGSQHYTIEGRDADASRDTYLNGLGLTILRYTNLQIHQEFENVCNDIFRYLVKYGSIKPKEE